MAKLYKATVLLIFCLLQGCGYQTRNGSSIVDISSGTEKTEVIIIGTIHNKHHQNPHYSPEVLRDIILSLKPDAILNELPLSKVDRNGRPLSRDRNKSPEGWAADTAARELGIKQIPFDRPDRQENFRKTEYFKKEKRAGKLKKEWVKQLKKKEPDCIDLKINTLWGYASTTEMHLLYSSSPEIINSGAHDAVIRSKKSLWHDIFPNKILPKYPDYEELIELYKFSRDQWNERNKIMAENIMKAAEEYRGKRLVVLTGATHRYILRDLLKNKGSIELKEYWEVKGQSTINREQEIEK